MDGWTVWPRAAYANAAAGGGQRRQDVPGTRARCGQARRHTFLLRGYDRYARLQKLFFCNPTGDALTTYKFHQMSSSPLSNMLV